MKRMAVVAALAIAALALTGALASVRAARGQQAKTFPSVYKVVAGIPVAGANGLLTLTGTLRAADGTHGTFKSTFKETRMAGGTVRCGGRTYHGPFTEDRKNPGGGTFRIVGWGVAAFRITRTVAVFRQAGVGSSPPVCFADTGTYRFESGSLKGKHGMYTELGQELLTGSASDTLVFH